MLRSIENYLLGQPDKFGAIPSRTEPFFDKPFHVIDFIPALQEQLGATLPPLHEPDARDKIIEFYRQRGNRLPSTPTLPRLLDDMCSNYLEHATSSPTWIINTPECLSPLAKSFAHPDIPHQRVAARAELFVNFKELVNCYEEENSPFEQRRKFIDQQKYGKLEGGKGDEEAHIIDEDYCEALEWGMPPTGGWGCGVDRLVMLLSGKDNISDVLSFGNLRKVTWSATGADKK
ncbi:mitochondrial lysine-tRNA synthetase, partial [Elasticomyces elasticus]